jgi:hypothetical protein
MRRKQPPRNSGGFITDDASIEAHRGSNGPRDQMVSRAILFC